MCRRIAILAAMCAVAPIGAGAAYLMVGREKGQAGGGRSSREIIAAFERETGKPVDLEQRSQSNIEAKALAAVV
jgi:hypothetical protein